MKQIMKNFKRCITCIIGMPEKEEIIKQNKYLKE